jgi:hypothetical protein
LLYIQWSSLLSLIFENFFLCLKIPIDNLSRRFCLFNFCLFKKMLKHVSSIPCQSLCVVTFFFSPVEIRCMCRTRWLSQQKNDRWFYTDNTNHLSFNYPHCLLINGYPIKERIAGAGVSSSNQSKSRRITSPIAII